MAEIKDKVVTVESLSTLHEHNKNTYMSATNPVGSGEMTINGNASFTGSVLIGSNVKLVSTGEGLSIVFLDEETDEETIEEITG